MRIIAGEYGSRRLIAPKGLDTRPTAEKTREALFSMLQGEVQDARVLDLFAGSGALGLEALSRGAASAVFCDHDREAARAIRMNITSLGLGSRASLLHMDWTKAVNALGEAGERFHLIFLDPPYRLEYAPIFIAITDAGLLLPQGILIAEHGADRRLEPPEHCSLWKHRRYQDSAVSLYRAEETEDEDSGISRQL